jgi:hypothetical protein
MAIVVDCVLLDRQSEIQVFNASFISGIDGVYR